MSLKFKPLGAIRSSHISGQVIPLKRALQSYEHLMIALHINSKLGEITAITSEQCCGPVVTSGTPFTARLTMAHTHTTASSINVSTILRN